MTDVIKNLRDRLGSIATNFGSTEQEALSSLGQNPDSGGFLRGTGIQSKFNSDTQPDAGFMRRNAKYARTGHPNPEGYDLPAVADEDVKPMARAFMGEMTPEAPASTDFNRLISSLGGEQPKVPRYLARGQHEGADIGDILKMILYFNPASAVAAGGYDMAQGQATKNPMRVVEGAMGPAVAGGWKGIAALMGVPAAGSLVGNNIFPETFSYHNEANPYPPPEEWRRK